MQECIRCACLCVLEKVTRRKRVFFCDTEKVEIFMKIRLFSKLPKKRPGSFQDAWEVVGSSSECIGGHFRLPKVDKKVPKFSTFFCMCSDFFFFCLLSLARGNFFEILAQVVFASQFKTECPSSRSINWSFSSARSAPNLLTHLLRNPQNFFAPSAQVNFYMCVLVKIFF